MRHGVFGGRGCSFEQYLDCGCMMTMLMVRAPKRIEGREERGERRGEWREEGVERREERGEREEG